MNVDLFVWFRLFNKRLFKKLSFLVLLFSIVLIAIFMKFSSNLDSGLISIAVCGKNVDKNVDLFQKNKGILHFTKVESESDGKKLLSVDKVQSVWVFDDDIEKNLSESAALESIQPVVTVIEKQDTVFMKFSRELLFSRLFPIFSHKAYKYYVRNVVNLDENAVSDETMESHYNRYLHSEPLIKIQTLKGDLQESNYLLAPLRGMFALWVLICSLAACLYYMQDLENGTFVWIKRKNHFFLMLGMNFIVVFNACVFFLLSVIFTGIFTNAVSEIVNLMLYCVAVILFSTFFMQLSGKINRFSCLIAPIVILSLVFTPIFVSLPSLKLFSQLLPAYYYLNGITDFSFTIKMLVYILILFAADFALFRIKQQLFVL